ncbi:hypothetical protein T439DRAFT_295646 [Meredithblackwellia eburnea MCA 4105]
MPGEDSTQRTINRTSLLTPLALLVFIAAAAIAAFVAHPSLDEISEDYLTILTPSTPLIAGYWAVLTLLLLATSFHQVLVKNEDSKVMIAYGLGLRLPLAIVLMSFWTLFFSLRLFVVAEIILLLNLVNLVSMWGTLLLYQPAEGARYIDWLLLHVPIRMLLCVLFTTDIWHQGLLALHWYRYLGTDPNVGSGHWEPSHPVHSWIAFGVVFGVGLVNAGVVFAFADIAWAASVIFLNIAMVLKTDGKPPQVYVTLILTAALVLVALASSIGYRLLHKDQEGAIRLTDDEDAPVPANDPRIEAARVRAAAGTSPAPADAANSV